MGGERGGREERGGDKEGKGGEGRGRKGKGGEGRGGEGRREEGRRGEGRRGEGRGRDLESYWFTSLHSIFPYFLFAGFFPEQGSPSLAPPTGVPLEELQHIGTVFSSPPEKITLHPGQ